jgi:hypothetical protein
LQQAYLLVSEQDRLGEVQALLLPDLDLLVVAVGVLLELAKRTPGNRLQLLLHALQTLHGQILLARKLFS